MDRTSTCRSKNIIWKIALSLSSCILTLLLLEIGVRVFLPVTLPKIIVKRDSPPDIKGKLGFVEPFFEGTFLSEEYQIEIKINSEGFRDVEHESIKPKGVFRVLVVGDSFTHGMGVEAAQVYSKILQKFLNEKSQYKMLRGYNASSHVENYGSANS